MSFEPSMTTVHRIDATGYEETYHHRTWDGFHACQRALEARGFRRVRWVRRLAPLITEVEETP